VTGRMPSQVALVCAAAEAIWSWMVEMTLILSTSVWKSFWSGGRAATRLAAATAAALASLAAARVVLALVVKASRALFKSWRVALMVKNNSLVESEW